MPSITGADLQHRADGGAIAGPGTETSDSIPIMASNNEYMVRATAHKKYGTAMLDAINNGSLYEYLQRTLGRIQDGTFANFGCEFLNLPREVPLEPRGPMPLAGSPPTLEQASAHLYTSTTMSMGGAWSIRI